MTPKTTSITAVAEAFFQACEGQGVGSVQHVLHAECDIFRSG